MISRKRRTGPPDEEAPRGGAPPGAESDAEAEFPEPGAQPGLADLLCGRSIAVLQRDMMARHGLPQGDPGFLDELAWSILAGLRSAGVRPCEDQGKREVLDSVLGGVELEDLATRTGLSPGTAAHWIWALVPLVMDSLHERGVEALDAPFLRRRASER